ncbi:MAG: sulfite exporter TauE/SafE family protein [Balneolaceae bacterium]
MEETVWIFPVLWLLLGMVTGFLAGLFGIGGGGLMVPVLTTLFLWQGISSEWVVHMALATSMSAIIVTAMSSVRAHHRFGAVDWKVVWSMTPGVIFGGWFTAWWTGSVSSAWLAIFFTLFMGGVSIRLFFSGQPTPSGDLPGRTGLAGAGALIGSISSLVAIGGGSLTVPFLVWKGKSIHQAVATSAGVGLPIALAGTAGYLMSGLQVQGLPQGSLGFIHLPAMICVASMSLLTAPLGARLSHRLPVVILKRLFGGLLMVLCAWMLYSLFG